MFTSRRLSIGTALTAAMLAPAAIAATTSHSHFWENKKNSVVCGYRAHPSGTKASQLLCSAKGIPKTGKTGDPFVAIGRTGKPKLLMLGGSEFPTGIPAVLANGTKWSGLGVTCTLGKTVTCKNTAHHGFTIGNGKYKPF